MKFLLEPPTNTRVFPISGMIFVGKWRYPPSFFRDRFPIYVIIFFEGIPKFEACPATLTYHGMYGILIMYNKYHHQEQIIINTKQAVTTTSKVEIK